MLRGLRPSAAVLLLLLLSPLLWAFDISNDIAPTGPLGVRLDYVLATRKGGNANRERDRVLVWTSHLTFNGPVSDISDGQMVQLTLDAHKEMDVNFRAYDPRIEGGYPERLPAVMTALAFGSEIIFASSEKGGESFISLVGTSHTWKALSQCQILWGELTGEAKDHAHGRHCGEVMAFHQYDVVHGKKDITSFPGEPRIVSVKLFQETGVTRVHAPCGDVVDDPGPEDTVRDLEGTLGGCLFSFFFFLYRFHGRLVRTTWLTDLQDKRWGCDFFLKQRMPGVRVIPASQQAEGYTLDNLSGGRPIIDNIGVCTRAKAKRMDTEGLEIDSQAMNVIEAGMLEGGAME